MMNFDQALQSVLQFDIKSHCHVNTNEDGDRFVGIKADSDDAMVYFPIGYQLPETDAAIRTDIKHLIQVLSEFTTRDDRLLAVNKFAAPQSVDFPINAYTSVIEYYFAIGGKYYVETEQTYKTAPTGKQDWARTARKQMPLVQNKNGISSFIFTQFEVRSSTPNDTKLITQINRFCVYEAFKRLGWLYVPYMPEDPGPHPDVKTSIAIVRAKLYATNDDKKKSLFQGMKDMLEYIDEKTSDKQFYFGTDDFDHVWEKLIDNAGKQDQGGLVIGTDGTVYASLKATGDLPGGIIALSPNNGEIKWQYESPESVSGTPAIDADGHILFGTEKGNFYILDSNGRDIVAALDVAGAITNSHSPYASEWLPTQGKFWSSPIIGNDGTIYIAITNVENEKQSLMVALTSGLVSGPATSAWPMKGKDPQHTSTIK